MGLARGRAASMAIAGALAIAGCGPGPGPGTADVGVAVTRDFGTVPLHALGEGGVPGSETVLQLLERHFRIGTRYGGDFVESIDGQSGSSAHLDWFFYVNGMEAAQGAGTTPVRHGDRIWWDLHDWAATDSVPAVVGSYPEPFVHGVDGHRDPTSVQCAADAGSACTTVVAALRRTGVTVTRRALQVGAAVGSSIPILVGTWSEISHNGTARLLAGGPTASGVYAQFATGGTGLALLGPHGQRVRTVGAGAGLVAATAAPGAALPTWLVTGTDLAGVDAAAAAMTASRLHDRFALAVDGGTELPVPLDPSS
jgi:hypothetical protein